MRTHCSPGVRVAIGATLISIQLVGMACSEATAPRVVPAQYIVTVSHSTAAAGDTILVKAQLADASGQSIARSGREVEWLRTNENGQFPSPESLTDENGVATNYFLVGTKANITEKVVVSDQDRLQGDSPPITIVPGQPSAYAVTVNTAAPAIGATVIVTAQLTDKFGNVDPVSGRVVTWSLSNNNAGGYNYQLLRINRLSAPKGGRRDAATFDAPTSTTNAQGVATVNFNVGTAFATTYVITARDEGGAVGNSPPLRVGPGPVAKLAVTPSVVDPPAGTTITINAVMTDVAGNAITIPGTRVDWSASGGSLSATSSYTDASGTATIRLTTDASAGKTYTVSASINQGAQTGTSPTITTLEQMSLASIASGFGSESSCGIATDSKLWCWGYEGLLSVRTVPGKPIGDQTVSAISTSAHTCAIATGTVICWGPNDAAQLGDNTHTSRSSPAPINSQLSFTAVTTGSAHTCALATTHDIYCWGTFADGRLGDGTGYNGASPIKVAGAVSFIAVSAGRAHTCAIATSGDAYCWGANDKGQLGTGSVTTSSSTPALVAGGLKFTAISAGDSHTCGITTSGVYCWGDNTFGQIGNGSLASIAAAPAQVRNSAAFSKIAAGGFTTCAISSDGTASCWGDNATWELGNPSVQSTHSSLPVAVAGGLTFTSIAIGGGSTSDYYYYTTQGFGHVCAVSTDGVTYCWGENSQGALGVSTDVASSPTPLKVDGQH